MGKSVQGIDDVCHLKLWIQDRKVKLSSTIPILCVLPGFTAEGLSMIPAYLLPAGITKPRKTQKQIKCR